MQRITLTGNPQSTNNIYRHAGNRTYMTAKGKALKEDYSWQLKIQYKSEPTVERVKLTVELYFGDKRTRDIDNYNKILLDACSGVLWKDDEQIDEITIRKHYDKMNPRIELSL